MLWVEMLFCFLNFVNCDNWQLFGHTFTKTAWNLKRVTFLLFLAFDIWHLSLFTVEISIEVQIYEGAYFDKPSDVLQAGIWKCTKCLQYHVFYLWKGIFIKEQKMSHDLKAGLWLAESHRSRDFLRLFKTKK